MLKKVLESLFFNSWTKTLFFLFICVLLTYFVVTNFSDLFMKLFEIKLFDLRKAETWSRLAVIIMVLFLLPTFLNTFYFLKIVQIADNTNKHNKLIERQNILLEKLLNKLN